MLNSKARRLLGIFRRGSLIRKPAFLAVLLMLGLTPAAHAIVIQNGSFDSGLTGWTTSAGITSSTGLILLGASTAAIIGTTGGDTAGTFSQSFTLADAGMVDYSFLAGRSETACGCTDVPLTFAVRIDDIILSNILPAYDPNGSGGSFGLILLTSYTGSVSLSAGAHVLAFEFSRGFNLFGRAPYFALDGVDVTAQEVVVDPPSTAVSEPITLSLLGAGLAGIGIARRTKQAHAAVTAA
jgi:hypothetical protein